MLNFNEDGCGIINSLLTKETIKFLSEYTFEQTNNKRVVEDESDRGGVIVGPPTHALYCDPVMNTISSMILPELEKVTGMELVPTYTYYRTYTPGNILLNHIDRCSSEISISILINAQYKPDKSYRWKLYADPEPYRNGVVLDRGNLPNNKGVDIIQKPGDGFLYLGQRIPHWRGEFVGDVGSFQTQLFCFFINKSGPYYPELKYDNRPGLGFPYVEKVNS